MDEEYKLNKEWLDLLLEHKNNANITFNLSSNDIRILLTYIEFLQQENKQLKMINKEYERLNKEKNRGFKITNVQEYNIDELLSYKKYKDNWNKLKDYIVKEYYMYLPLEASTKSITILIDKMQELEQGSDSNG